MSASSWMPLLLDQIRGAVAGGVDVVQLREPGLEARTCVALAREALSITRGTQCRLLVNDRLDVALAAGGDGVHLREGGIPIDAARSIGHGAFTIGRSVHTPRAAAASRNADYLIAGSVFDTESKPGQPASLGLDGLRQVVAAADGCPVWAVGGVSADRFDDLVRCGIRGVAAIGAFLPPAGSRNITLEVQRQTESLRIALDRAGELP